MQFIMKQAEIEVAVRQYVAKMGINAPIDEVSFTATRGADGITASIEIGGLSIGGSDGAAKSNVASIASAQTGSDDDAATLGVETAAPAATAGLFAVDNGPSEPAAAPTEEGPEIPAGKSLFG